MSSINMYQVTCNLSTTNNECLRLITYQFLYLHLLIDLVEESKYSSIREAACNCIKIILQSVAGTFYLLFVLMCCVRVRFSTAVVEPSLETGG